MKNATLETKTYLKNTGSITVDTLADIEKQNTETAVSVDGSWGLRGWTSQNGVVGVCLEEIDKVLDITLKSASCRQCSKMKGKKNLERYPTSTTCNHLQKILGKLLYLGKVKKKL